MSVRPLEGMRVLVTRPEHQAGPLCELIREAGGEPLLLPALTIAPPADPGAIREIARRLHEVDIAVFVSPNAVRSALKLLDRRLPSAVRLAAIGPATAKALVDAGYEDIIVPDSEFNSEALLQHHALRRVQGAKVVIFRGDGGRGLLREVLESRGAEVVYAEVYRRGDPHQPSDEVREALRKRHLDVVTVTSEQALEQLVRLCRDEMRDGLFAAQLVVPSGRMVKLAESLGFRTPMVATEPGDQAIADALIAWRTGRPPQETA